jgi:pimeloyl-ACP methyl ester carboxylesterase
MLVTRCRGTIDHWDPALLDVLSAERDIIVFDYPGVNLSSGTTPATVAGLAASVAEFISALGLQHVDLLSWSMGGYVVQDLCLNNPGLVRRLVIAASGPGAVPARPLRRTSCGRSPPSPSMTTRTSCICSSPRPDRHGGPG